jgi:hypothetical protein
MFTVSQSLKVIKYSKTGRNSFKGIFFDHVSAIQTPTSLSQKLNAINSNCQSCWENRILFTTDIKTKYLHPSRTFNNINTF